MEYPLYLSIEQAATYTGIGQNTLRDWLNSKDPMPYLAIGNRKLIQRDALSDYLTSKQEVKP